jgi:uncharacterized protein (DUF58 family)
MLNSGWNACSMRLGRIILALLTPLVSLPALANGSTRDRLPPAPAADSLLNLLRSVVPLAASSAETGTHAKVHRPGVAPPAFAPFIMANLVVTCSPATEATLRLQARQHHRALLRC